MRLWLRPRHRGRHHSADPSFLFSTWPIPEWDGRSKSSTIHLTPTGGDDQPSMQQAVNRIFAVGGGVVRLHPGTFKLTEPFYLDSPNG
jgi:hypothetical protein